MTDDEDDEGAPLPHPFPPHRTLSSALAAQSPPNTTTVNPVAPAVLVAPTHAPHAACIVEAPVDRSASPRRGPMEHTRAGAHDRRHDSASLATANRGVSSLLLFLPSPFMSTRCRMEALFSTVADVCAVESTATCSLMKSFDYSKKYTVLISCSVHTQVESTGRATGKMHSRSVRSQTLG